MSAEDEQRDEIEALSSIFGEDFELVNSNTHKVYIAPHPGNDQTNNHG
jgi:RWD domain